MIAFLTFANDHKGHLPGNFVDFDQRDQEQRSWLLNSGEPWTAAPQGGTIFRYLKSPQVYLCPTSRDVTIYNANVGSNGRFDYAAIGIFTGAIVTRIPRQSRFDEGNGKSTLALTPIICEEEPRNGINGGNVEGLHNASDRIAAVHKGGGYYATLDGSVHWFKEPKGTSAYNWYSRAAERQRGLPRHPWLWHPLGLV